MSVTTAGRAFGITLRRRQAHPGGLGIAGKLALAALGTFALLAVAGPWLAPHDPHLVDLRASYWAPDLTHPLGYDGQGRDVLSRLLAGARTSFLGPLAIVLFAVVAGTSIAIAAAWQGGWLDSAVSATIDAVLAFPGLLLAVLTVAVFGPGLSAAVLALGMAYAPHMARLVRAAALREVGRDYVDALRVQGHSSLLICVRHIVPNVLPVVVGQAALILAWATVDVAALSYLGLGVQPPQADWGVMVASGQSGVLEGYPMESLAAGICLIVAASSFNLLGQRVLGRMEVRTA